MLHCLFIRCAITDSQQQQPVHGSHAKNKTINGGYNPSENVCDYARKNGAVAHMTIELPTKSILNVCLSLSLQTRFPVGTRPSAVAGRNACPIPRCS